MAWDTDCTWRAQSLFLWIQCRIKCISPCQKPELWAEAQLSLLTNLAQYTPHVEHMGVDGCGQPQIQQSLPHQHYWDSTTWQGSDTNCRIKCLPPCQKLALSQGRNYLSLTNLAQSMPRVEHIGVDGHGRPLMYQHSGPSKQQVRRDTGISNYGNQ